MSIGSFLRKVTKPIVSVIKGGSTSGGSTTTSVSTGSTSLGSVTSTHYSDTSGGPTVGTTTTYSGGGGGGGGSSGGGGGTRTVSTGITPSTPQGTTTPITKIIPPKPTPLPTASQLLTPSASANQLSQAQRNLYDSS